MQLRQWLLDQKPRTHAAAQLLTLTLTAQSLHMMQLLLPTSPS
jgi:hypothetical protein